MAVSIKWGVHFMGILIKNPSILGVYVRGPGFKETPHEFDVFVLVDVQDKGTAWRYTDGKFGSM